MKKITSLVIIFSLLIVHIQASSINNPSQKALAKKQLAREQRNNAIIQSQKQRTNKFNTAWKRECTDAEYKLLQDDVRYVQSIQKRYRKDPQLHFSLMYQDAKFEEMAVVHTIHHINMLQEQIATTIETTKANKFPELKGLPNLENLPDLKDLPKSMLKQIKHEVLFEWKNVDQKDINPNCDTIEVMTHELLPGISGEHRQQAELEIFNSDKNLQTKYTNMISTVTKIHRDLRITTQKKLQVKQILKAHEKHLKLHTLSQQTPLQLTWDSEQNDERAAKIKNTVIKNMNDTTIKNSNENNSRKLTNEELFTPGKVICSWNLKKQNQIAQAIQAKVLIETQNSKNTRSHKKTN